MTADAFLDEVPPSRNGAHQPPLAGQHRASLLSVAAIWVAGSLISFGRLWVANPDGPIQVLWAEDGLFPLCVVKSGFWSCLTDPFAGYLLLVPRLAAGLVAPLPASDWALATNVLAAVLAGALCAIAFTWARRWGLGVIAACIVGLLPVAAPLVGLEAINALGSIYMPMLYVATLMITLQRSDWRISRGAAFAGSGLLLMTALTIPLAALLLAPMAWQVVRRAMSRGVAALWSAAIGLGSIAQALTALNAERPREIAIGLDSLGSYLDTLPKSLLSYWPGLIVTPFDYDVNYRIVPVTFTGTILVAVLVLACAALLLRRSDRTVAAGLMVALGLGYGLLPSIIGWANNRYFVVPVLLWAAAVVIVAERPLSLWARTWTRRLALVLLGALIVVVWSPMIPASAWRSTPAPAWQGEVERVIARCQAEPEVVERPVFTPFWPPNWGDGLSEPTHPNFPCVLAWRWS